MLNAEASLLADARIRVEDSSRSDGLLDSEGELTPRGRSRPWPRQCSCYWHLFFRMDRLRDNHASSTRFSHSRRQCRNRSSPCDGREAGSSSRAVELSRFTPLLAASFSSYNNTAPTSMPRSKDGRHHHHRPGRVRADASGRAGSGAAQRRVRGRGARRDARPRHPAARLPRLRAARAAQPASRAGHRVGLRPAPRLGRPAVEPGRPQARAGLPRGGRNGRHLQRPDRALRLGGRRLAPRRRHDPRRHLDPDGGAAPVDHAGGAAPGGGERGGQGDGLRDQPRPHVREAARAQRPGDARRRAGERSAATAPARAMSADFGGATLALKPEDITVAVQVHARFAAS